MNLAALTDAELAELHARLAQQRTDIVTQMQSVHDEQQRRLGEAALQELLAGYSPEQRERLRAALNAR